MVGFNPTGPYEPQSVKSLLHEMKDRSGLLLDLAYSAVLLVDHDITPIVFDLVDEVDALELQARMSLLLATRSPSDAEQLAPVLGIIDAVDDVSDAVAEIITILGDDNQTLSDLRGAVPATTPIVVWESIGDELQFGGHPLDDVQSVIGPDVNIVAIRREEEWIFDPSRELELANGDVLFLRGARETVQTIDLTNGRLLEPRPSPPAHIDDVDVAARIIVRMKRFAELAVDLAYGSILYDSPALADEVQQIERELHECENRLEDWTLQSVRRGTKPADVRWFINIGRCSQLISDAALEMSEGVLLGIETHPVVGEAIEESEEHIHRLAVDPRSDAVGSTLDELNLINGIEGTVLAIRRASDEWVLVPNGVTIIEPNDILLTKERRESEYYPYSDKL